MVNLGWPEVLTSLPLWNHLSTRSVSDLICINSDFPIWIGACSGPNDLPLCTGSCSLSLLSRFILKKFQIFKVTLPGLSLFGAILTLIKEISDFQRPLLDSLCQFAILAFIKAISDFQRPLLDSPCLVAILIFSKEISDFQRPLLDSPCLVAILNFSKEISDFQRPLLDSLCFLKWLLQF